MTVIQMHSVPIMQDHSAVSATQDILEMVKLVQVINLFTYPFIILRRIVRRDF